MPGTRHRIVAFAHFTWRRFLDDRCLESAGALACTSLFALVPLSAALLGILSEFPTFAQWQESVTTFVFANFVPATGEAVRGYLTQFADNASKATTVGVIALLGSTLMLMLSVEDAFNRIWRVPTSRPAGLRFVRYWTVLSLGPLLLIVALALSTYLFALPLFDGAKTRSVETLLLGRLPFLIEWIALIAAYTLIPNSRVPLRHAAIGALAASLALEGAKRAFAWYITSAASYEQVYGALAVVPIFILWIYLLWGLVLLGASLTATLTAFDYLPHEQRLAPGEEFRGLVRVLAHFAAAQRAGVGLSSMRLRDQEPFLTHDLLQRYLDDLEQAGVIQRNNRGEWIVARDLASISLYDIYAACHYRLPLGGPLPTAAAAPDGPASALLGRAASGLRETMSRPLAEIFPAQSRSAAQGQSSSSKESSS